MPTIITFLNDKGLREGAVYRWQGNDYPVGAFVLALRQFVKHDRMLACSTPEAEHNTWPALAELHDPRIELVSISKGETTAELWEIFDRVTARVHEGESVIFDITQGLRSLPFLVFLFAAYLASAKRVVIEAVYYGALEMGSPAPVLDLSEFTRMLEWITATDAFTQTGDARRLANLLTAGGPGLAAQASRALSQVSRAASLCQPFTLMRDARSLDRILREAQPDLANKAHPFGLLREQIAGAFSAFGAEPASDFQGAIRSEFKLIQWYYQNGQLIQAMSLAREWLIDAATWRLGRPFDLTRETRKRMEEALSGLPKVGGPHPQSDRKFLPTDLNEFGRTIYDTWEEKDLLTRLWTALQDVRNGLDHAEHQKNPLPLKTIQKKVDSEIMPHLCELANRWTLDRPPSGANTTQQNDHSTGSSPGKRRPIDGEDHVAR